MLEKHPHIDKLVFNMYLQLCALHVTDRARARILKAGGNIITFDQLALKSPKGQNTLLLQGPRKGRDAYSHFGKAPGVPHSNTAYVVTILNILSGCKRCNDYMFTYNSNLQY